jgi:hypothetical protein
MRTKIDKKVKIELLRTLLSQEGISDGAMLRDRLQVSQPVFSRLTAMLGDELLITGRSRSTRYSLIRSLEGIPAAVPIYEVEQQGTTRRVGVLHAVRPHGFVFESFTDDVPGGYYDDLPFFIDDLRPAGFLGRLVPRQHPELSLPSDIRDWSAEHNLKYLCRFGWDCVGALIVGEEAFELFLKHVQNPPDFIDMADRSREYIKRARNILAYGVPGSSAAGEQPKFLAVRSSDRQPVMVKFVLDPRSVVGRRRTDLLIAEHVVHQVLQRHNCSVARSELVFGDGGELFLEIERFDRLGTQGRRGIISLRVLDNQFVGRLGEWGKTAVALQKSGTIDGKAVYQIRWFDLFGRLIANSDMHEGNVSFFTRGALCIEIAPVYDMLPMFFATRIDDNVNNVVSKSTQVIGDVQPWTTVPLSTSTAGDAIASRYTTRDQAATYSVLKSAEDWVPPTPSPVDVDLWPTVLDAALDFWEMLSSHEEISGDFKEIAQRCNEKLRTLENLVALLPRA